MACHKTKWHHQGILFTSLRTSMRIRLQWTRKVTLHSYRPISFLHWGGKGEWIWTNKMVHHSIAQTDLWNSSAGISLVTDSFCDTTLATLLSWSQYTWPHSTVWIHENNPQNLAAWKDNKEWEPSTQQLTWLTSHRKF